MNEVKRRFRRKIGFSLMVLMAVIFMISIASVVNVFAQESGQPAPPVTEEQASISRFGLMAAAVAFGLGAIGAGLAIGSVGAAAMGAIGEKPEIAGQALIFVALAEGLVVFGFITALLILGKI